MGTRGESKVSEYNDGLKTCPKVPDALNSLMTLENERKTAQDSNTCRVKGENAPKQSAIFRELIHYDAKSSR
jgi:hypothetical protein